MPITRKAAALKQEPAKEVAPKVDHSADQAEAAMRVADEARISNTILKQILDKPTPEFPEYPKRPKKIIATVTGWVKVDGQNRIKTLEIKLE